MDAFLGEIGVERAALVGNSMGGFIAAETAISHPSRVEKLVLVSAAGGLTLHEWHTDWRRSVAAREPACSTSSPPHAFARREHWSCAAAACAACCCTRSCDIPTASQPELCYEIASGAGKPGFLDAFGDLRLRLPRPAARTSRTRP